MLTAAPFSLMLPGLVLLSGAHLVHADPWDVKSDTWVATDALGRKLPGYGQCGAPRANKFVGIFYFLWLGQHGTGGPYDNTKILAQNPENPQWGPEHAFHHWGESELGYYLSNDEYVIRKHCHMLVDAGVDMIALDVTNSFTYTTNYMTVCNVYNQIRQGGGKTPQICFLTNSNSDAVVQQLYTEFYSQNLYPDLWFRWLAKPLMMANPANLSQTLKDFFTFRQSWAWSHPAGWFGTGQDKWPWLDHHPQNYGWHVPGMPEQISVCVAQHATTNIGRSFHNGAQPPPAQFQTDVGLCFAEQWRRALQVDPEFVFITGWNEWVAQRFLSDGTATFLGQTLPAGETYFVDAYIQEYSRDIEPMKGGHTDNYYYQMVDNIRRFKGVRPPETPTPPKTIMIDGIFTDWDDVGPEFRDTVGDTTVRLHQGWGNAGIYSNSTGRNDIVTAKVARDENNLYFFVSTQANMTPRTDDNWMMLFIDADCDGDNGWFGYEYLVNGVTLNATTTTVKHSNGGWNWDLVGEVSYRVLLNKMEIAVPRAMLGQNQASKITLDFHWADNIQATDNIIEFAISGDSAPNRRFKYRYDADHPAPLPLTSFAGTRTQSDITLNWTYPPPTGSNIGTVIRFRTDHFPVESSDGTLLCDRSTVPNSNDSVVLQPISRKAPYYFAAFNYDCRGTYAPAGQLLLQPWALPDLDADGDVDQSDFGSLQACFTGPSLINSDPQCGIADIDGDLDIDAQDFSLFLGCYSGPDIPADSGCTPP